MKTIILLFILLISSVMAVSQDKGFRILPEGGLSLPTGDFKSKYTFGSQGFYGGLNAEYFWGKFGVGLFGGINNNGIDYQDDLPPVGGLIISKPNNIIRDSWKQLLVALGPTYKMGLTGKLDLEFSLKFGFSKFTKPEYAESIQTGAPLNQRYLMYEAMNQDIEKGLEFATIPGIRLSFKPSEKVAISLGANYTSAMGVEHSYTFLDGDFNPDMSDEQLAAVLRTAPTVYELRKCNFNTIGITLGVGFTFGGKDKPKEDPEEDEKMEPPIPQFPEDGSTITPEEADSLVLEWVKETPNVEKANYNFWLYEVQDTTKESDSLIFQKKIIKDTLLELPDDVQLRIGGLYRWGVQSIEAKELKPCPGNCYSITAIFRVGTPVDVLLKRKLDSGYYTLTSGILRFKYDEEYVNNGSELEFNIYDYTRTVVISNASPGVALNTLYKDNRFILNINAINPSLPQGYYVLEVKDKKGEVWMLRFKK